MGLFAAAVAATAAQERRADGERARLAVVIVVDQLRADQALAFEHSGEAGGFARFFRHGTIYENARYEHAFTLTSPGHATIFTGEHPSSHGIVANLWYSRAEGRRVESIYDPAYREFGTDASWSPRMLRVGTVGDRLVGATAGRALVAAVAGKAHSAILSAGKLGKAFWYEPMAGGFTTSNYYYERLPAWVDRWNADARQTLPTIWSSAPDSSADRAPDATDEFERPPAGMGRAFPHVLGRPGSPQLLANLRYSPILDEITLKFAAALVEKWRLGADTEPDLLAISLAATDYIGHAFGPDSREARENLDRLDRALASFFKALDESVGAESYVLVLTSDHGVGPIPEQQAKRGGSGYRVGMANVVRDVNLQLRRRFDVDVDLIEAFASPFIYFDLAAAESRGIEREELQAAAIRMLESIPGIARAVPTDSPDFDDDSELQSMIRRGIAPVRSGDLCVIQERWGYLHDDAEKNATTHGSPYDYDRHVPMMIYGAGIEARRVTRQASPREIASLLSGYLGIPGASAAAEPPR